MATKIRRTMIGLGISILLAICFIVISMFIFTTSRTSNLAHPNIGNIVVFTLKDLSEGHHVVAEDLEERSCDPKKVPRDTVPSIEYAVGKTIKHSVNKESILSQYDLKEVDLKNKNESKKSVQ